MPSSVDCWSMVFLARQSPAHSGIIFLRLLANIFITLIFVLRTGSGFLFKRPSCIPFIMLVACTHLIILIFRFGINYLEHTKTQQHLCVNVDLVSMWNRG